MHVMRRDDKKLLSRQIHFHTLRRDAYHPSRRHPFGAEVRQKTGPLVGNENLRVGNQQPSIGRSNDIQVLVGGKYIIQMRRQEVAGHLGQQILVGEVTTGVQKHTFAVMDDEKLIGLNAFTLYQIGEFNTFMDAIILKYRTQCLISH